MLAFQHKGRTYNLPIKTSGLTGDATVDAASAYIQGLVAGRVVSLSSTGVQLCDGIVVGALQPFGFLVNDAAGYTLENKPALASGLVAVARGPENTIITDQIDPNVTFALGDLLWVGNATASTAGLVTNVKPTGSNSNPVLIGIATSTASVSAPQLTVALV